MLRKEAIAKIKDIHHKAFNAEQKQLAIEMIEKAPDHAIKAWYDFIIQRVKLGFTFDYAPEPNVKKISLIENQPNLNIVKDENEITHKLIIGDNFDGLKNLLITHRNKIDIIYIDPPYNTEAASGEGNNQFSQSGEYTGTKTIENPNTGKFIYRDKFARTGWLNMLNERLKLAKELLSDQGVIFVSIDDNEQAYLKVLMDEIFGEEHFICNFDWISKPGGQPDNKFVAKTKQYVLMYKKSDLFIMKKHYKTVDEKDIYSSDEKGQYIKSTELNSPSSIESRHAWNRINLAFHVYYNPINKDIKFSPSWDLEKQIYIKPKKIKEYFVASPKKENLCWRWAKEAILKRKNELIFITKNDGSLKIFKKQYIFNNKKISFIRDSMVRNISQGLGTSLLKQIFNKIVFPYPKPIELIKKILNLSPNQNATVLDFYAGSGTTAHAVMDLNREDGGKRECILITNNENNLAYDVTYERLHRIIKQKGTKGETDFVWLNQKIDYSINNLKVFVLKEHDIRLNIDIDQLLKYANQQLKQLDSEFNCDQDSLAKKLQGLYPLLKK